MSFSAFHCTCQKCGKRFWAYPNRKGSSGTYPKFCSRACYTADVKQTAECNRLRRERKEQSTVRVPAAFFEDHESRDCEPYCEPVKKSGCYVWLRLDDPGLEELLSDARHYADPAWTLDPCYFGLKRSAVATVKAIEAATASK